MTMSPPSQQTDLFGTVLDFQTSSSAARRARTSAAPTQKAKVSTESDPVSTSKPSVSSTNADLVGSLLKIALISELEAQTGSSMRWRQSATPAGHSWLVLETSAPTTSESEAGLSGSIFHTPTTQANFAAPSMQKWESCQPWNVMLATPRKTDADRGGRGDILSQLRGYPSKHAGMPTPRKSDAHHGPEISKALANNTTGVSLVTTKAMGERQLLPTPVKRDAGRGRAGSDAWKHPRGRPLGEHMHQAMHELETGTMDANMHKWAGARALASLLQSHGLTGTAALPITYGWMMGYPAGWLSRALQSAVQKGLLRQASSSRRLVTPSARKSQKPSGEPS